jgi:hypothetical protein
VAQSRFELAPPENEAKERYANSFGINFLCGTTDQCCPTPFGIRNLTHTLVTTLGLGIGPSQGVCLHRTETEIHILVIILDYV